MTMRLRCLARVRVPLISGFALALSATEVFAAGDTTPGARSELEDDMVACAAQTNMIERAACYDGVATEFGLAVTTAAPAIEGAGKWQVSQQTNPVDDTQSVYLMLTADSGVSEYGKPIGLVARCQSNTTEVYVDWSSYVGDDSSDVYSDWKYVTVRIDAELAERQRWSVSSNNEATFAPDWPGSLLKRMADADQLILGLTPYGANPIVAIFDIRGLAAALPPLSRACGWEMG